MAYQLIIAEKPSVARAIASVIGAKTKKEGYLEGNGYIVTWCVGHLVTLASPEQYDKKYDGRWSFDTLPILPQEWKFVISKSTEKQFQVIKKLMLDTHVDELICATDAGREGECIFRYVYQKIGCKKPCKRLWISSMEDKAIQEGFSHLRPDSDFENLYAAGLCRAKADWLVGMNGTRLFSCRYNTLLSIGRVQTPTLAMIVQRDSDVKHFVKQKFFTVELDCGNFTASSQRLDDESDAKFMADTCNGKSACVKDVQKEIKTVNPPKLYDLTTLQREANRHYGYTAQQTLNYTQSLYEQKLVTYPRTDSQFLTEDMERTALEMVQTICNVIPYCQDIVLAPNVKRCINNTKVSDHHAIIPTAEIEQKNLDDLPDGERNILFLIAAKLVMATADPHRYEAVKATISCENHIFSATGKTVTEPGWKAVSSRIKVGLKCESTEETSDKEKSLPELTKGQIFDSVSAFRAEHFTSPPKPYTEDTLLKAMETAGNDAYEEHTGVEKKGLGTPATRAAILETLVKREFIKREKKQILPTEKGIRLIAAVPEEVKSARLTADWEIKLQDIEKGQNTSAQFLSEIETFVRDLTAKYSTTAEDAVLRKKQESIGMCPKCGKEIKKGQYGFYCTGKCGMNVAKIFGKALTEAQLVKLLSGNEISYQANGRKTTVLPKVISHEYNGKTYFQWETK